MATIYRADGGREAAVPKNKKRFSVKELQRIVGGYTRHVYLTGNSAVMVLNKEGELEQLPLNVKATEILRKNFPDSVEIVVGDVLITETDKL
ncbi:MAG: DUF3846 domain-containing protein [Prevotellaceae bacterium]|jgi:hypothetical protein|nr:DUF3846 domain-containing protein [Prevotellaceae bacterium]